MAHAGVARELLVERRLGLTMRRILVLNAFLTVAAAALFALGPARLEQLPAPVELPWPLIALAICACEVLAVNLHLRGETHAVSLGDIPIVLGCSSSRRSSW